MHSHYPEALFGISHWIHLLTILACLKWAIDMIIKDLVKQLTEHLNYDVEAVCETQEKSQSGVASSISIQQMSNNRIESIFW